MSYSIRAYDKGDQQAIVDIYNYYIENTAYTFDLTPHTLAKRQEWFAYFDAGGYPCFVVVDGGAVQGYACAFQFRPKAAYARSVETSIYLAPTFTQRGAGTALYDTLLSNLNGYHRALAGITQPNPASTALHRKFGFAPVGVMSEVGYKFNRYWDVLWYEKPI